ncbi:CPBP family intramembrane metalloprotease [Hymenobacter busanensis]|uniref:CPBP family intramembrane metalloprotease n=1 Tax=Hymenobacter busanensis TaxID=2607656 RepID=A0A7L4ZZV3_9BACT|nr:type II CAAX endopeptidase family protein [Hymenobacter busanensis]KAA9331312.1 CPBP family intramembrane metalloprotease [Hymenobacter busanensis]QHJ08463.1 CPBP family intramembrane metalloprotease [Hymenobacter busanensis]
MKGFPRTEDTLHPALSLLLLVMLVGAGMCLGMFVAVAIVSGLYGVELLRLPEVLGAPTRHAHGWEILMWLQGLTLLMGFGAGALALPIIRDLRPTSYFMPRRSVPLWWPVAAMVLIVISVPALSGLIAWNADLHLPSWLYEFERWARFKEDQAQELTTFLTRFNTPSRFWVAVLVVAVIPAIAEELTFRGVVLRQFTRWTGSVHWGVWLSAIVFSAIHVQFFGFFPRVLLGVLLGYLFAWSGNILVSMAAHFAQNFFQLLLLYLQQRNSIEFDADSTEALPWYWMLLSTVLTLGLLYWLYQRRIQVQTAVLPLGHTLSAEGIAAAAPVAGEAHTLSTRGVAKAPGPDATPA